MTTTNKTACKCGGCPAVRMARGLPPFCQMATPAPMRAPGWSTYEAAAAANPGKSIRLILLTGFQRRFDVA